MKGIYFFISLFFILFSGGQDAYARVQHKPFHKVVKHDLARNHHGKLVNKDTDSTLIEDTDLDIDEEVSADNVKDSGNGKLIVEKYGASPAQFTGFSYLDNFTYFKNFPAFNSHSSPIYIVQRVLRI